MWVYPEIRTLGEYSEYYARHTPSKPALIEGERVIDFAEFDQESNKVANALLKWGVQADDRIGFIGMNSADFYFALTGCAKTRGAFTVLNWRLAAPELAAIIEDCQTRLVIAERALEELWNAVLGLCVSDIETIWIDSEQTLSAIVADQSAEKPSGFISEDDCAIQLYTSGTTGKPKGVVLTHGGFNRMRLCEHLEPAYDWQEGDVFINALPNFHLLCIGIAYQCLYNGVAISVCRMFDPALVLKTIQKDRPTLLTLTPTMLQMLLDHPDAQNTDFSSIRTTLYAGSAISLGLIKRAIEKMPGEFMQFYGATEANGAFSILRPDEHNLDEEEKLKSCGRPLPFIEFKIVDQDGNEVETGTAGELVARSPAITSGYWNQPEASAKVLVNGWYSTGDVARQDEEGLYYIVDRVKDMIVSGGENIYSSEVENVISTHPDISMVAVIGVPDESWGEAVKAMVILNSGASISEEELIAYCRSNLAGYKVPKSVEFVDEFPLVPSGKVSKKELRERFWGDQERGVA